MIVDAAVVAAEAVVSSSAVGLVGRSEKRFSYPGTAMDRCKLTSYSDTDTFFTEWVKVDLLDRLEYTY